MAALFGGLLQENTIEFEPTNDGKSPSTRLRAVLYVLWEQEFKATFKTFETFYASKMEEMIEHFKEKLT